MVGIVRFSSALICLLWLASCSLIDFAYNNAAGFVVSEFDDAFDLTDLQSDQLDARLEQFFAWHRQQELQRYQQLLEQAANDAADGIQAQEFLDLLDDIRDAWRRAVAKAIDSMGDLAATLDRRQIERYRRYHRDASEEFADYLAKSAQQREIFRVARDVARLEKWFGDFDIFLADRVSVRLQQLPDIYEPWYRYREARHRALAAALDQAAAGNLSREQLKFIMLDDTTAHAREFEPARQAYWQAYALALADISSWLSNAQRQHAIAKLRDYARVAERLSQQG